MNKLVKVATIVAGVGAMFCFAGCGNDNSGTAQNDPDVAKYSALLEECVKGGAFTKDEAKQEMTKFNAMNPADRKKALEGINKFINGK